jgi:hypothetical protein
MKKANPHGDNIHMFSGSHVSGYSGYRRNDSIDVDVDQFGYAPKSVGVNPFMRPPSNVSRSLGRGSVWRQRFRDAGDSSLGKEEFKAMLQDGDPRLNPDDTRTICDAVAGESSGTVKYKDWARYLNKYQRKEHSITPSTDHDGMKESISKSAWGNNSLNQRSSKRPNAKRVGRPGSSARGPPQGIEYAQATRMFQGRNRGVKHPWVTTSEAFNNRIYDNRTARANQDSWFATTQRGWQSPSSSRPSLDLSMSMNSSMNTTVARPMSANSRFLTTNQKNSMRIYGGLQN